MRVVVTRAAHQAEELAAPLRAIGADVILLPVIGITEPLDPEPLRRGAVNVNTYDWVVFTSANGVASFARYLSVAPAEVKARIAVVGSATQSVAEGLGFAVSLTPAKYAGEALAAELGGEELAGKRILIPAAAVARDVVPRELRKWGAHVEVVEAYRNSLPVEAESLAKQIFQAPLPDWVIFASPSAVDNLIALLPRDALASVKIASIGPVTSAAVEAHGFRVTVEADPHTVEGLVDALMPYSPSGIRTQ